MVWCPRGLFIELYTRYKVIGHIKLYVILEVVSIFIPTLHVHIRPFVMTSSADVTPAAAGICDAAAGSSIPTPNTHLCNIWTGRVCVTCNMLWAHIPNACPVEPPAVFLSEVLPKKRVSNHLCNCEVVALKVIAKSGLNFFESFLVFLPSCQVISTVI